MRPLLGFLRLAKFLLAYFGSMVRTERMIWV